MIASDSSQLPALELDDRNQTLTDIHYRIQAVSAVAQCLDGLPDGQLEDMSTTLARIAVRARQELVGAGPKAASPREEHYYLAEALLTAIAIAALVGGGHGVAAPDCSPYSDQRGTLIPEPKDALNDALRLCMLAEALWPAPEWDTETLEEVAHV